MISRWNEHNEEKPEYEANEYISTILPASVQDCEREDLNDLILEHSYNFAGGDENSYMFYTQHVDVQQKCTSKLQTYTFYKLYCVRSVMHAIIHFKPIRELKTDSGIKFATEQPYFLKFTEDDAILENFDGELMKLTNHNFKFLTKSDLFTFFVWRNVIIVVKRTDTNNSTRFIPACFYNQQLCVVELQRDVPSPTAIYVQDNCFYMLCEGAIFVFNERFELKTHKSDTPNCHFFGATNSGFFSCAPVFSLSEKVPDQIYRFVKSRFGRSFDVRLENPEYLQLRKIIRDRDEQIHQLSKQLLQLYPGSRFVTEFDVVDIIGIGSYGTVFKMLNKLDKLEYAIKRIAVEPDNEQHERLAKTEIRVLARIDHPGFVRCFSSWKDHPPTGWQHIADAEILKRIPQKNFVWSSYKPNCFFYYIQMQLGTSPLVEWLANNTSDISRPLPRMILMIKQLVEAVAYLHETHHLIHQDLKPGNIVFSESGHLKIVDLGSVVKQEIVNGTEVAIKRDREGTEEYMSPEQRSIRNHLDSKTDVFTLGLLFAEFVVPLDNNRKNKIFNDVRKGKPIDIFGADHRSRAFFSLLTAMDSSMRPSCREILEGPHLTNC